VDDHELARLLSGRPGPSVLEKEAIRERMLAQHSLRRRALRWSWLVPLAASATAAFVMARVGDGDEFSSRGDRAEQPVLRVVCVDTGAVGSCPAGGTLAFQGAGTAYPYLAVFARRSDGLVIWYFPSATGPEDVAAPDPRAPLAHGIRLGDEQPPGRYEIVGVFSQRPLSRSEVKARLRDGLASGRGLKVVRQPFTVQAAR
jgi:hypothetical protein